MSLLTTRVSYLAHMTAIALLQDKEDATFASSCSMSISVSTPRRALITGAGSGIGQALSVSLALEHGWQIIVTDMSLVRASHIPYMASRSMLVADCLKPA